MKSKIIIIIFLFSFLGLSSSLFGSTVFLVELGNTELELDFQLFYTSLAWYAPFTSEAVTNLESESEGKIYGYLLKRIYAPRFLVIEGSVYPMPLLGVGIKHWWPEFYEWSQVFTGFNVVESITTGEFMEPYAFSLFLGNVVNFTPLSYTNKSGSRVINLSEYEGKGYSGFLVSYGSQHIHNNNLIPDHWLEFEIKLKGSRFRDSEEMSWSYRIGGRVHLNSLIKSYVYLGIKREHLDTEHYKFSFIKNSYVSLKLDFETDNFNFMKVLFQIGKKFPLRKSSITPELKIGFIYHFNSPYYGELANTYDVDKFKFLFTPNVIF